MPLTEADLDRLFSGDVRVAVSAVAEAGADLGELLADERSQIEAAAEKRRAEFTAGRVCARRLLREMGIEDAPLLSDDDRAPRWPAGVIGSISHSGGLCAVAVAWADDVSGIGLDLERAEAVREKIWPRICRPAEIERLRAEPEDKRAQLATLLFSAKEATYKCLFPGSRVPLGFQDVELELDVHAGRFTATLHRDTSPLACMGDVLEGRCFLFQDWVASALVLAQSP